MQEQLKKLEAAGQSFEGETDRGCAVLAVAILEERLRDSLKTRLSVDDQDLSQFVPMGAMGKGVKLAKMVGLITHAWEADWKLVLKIRNEFAHSASIDLSFDADPIAPWVRDLKVIPPMPGQTNRSRFLWIVNALYGLLLWLTLNVGAIPIPNVSSWPANASAARSKGK